jgi:hypothetical protein
MFEVVRDLDDVHQENVNHGWEQPPPPAHHHPDGWNPWPEPQEEGIDDNELNLVNNLADDIVAQAAANGLMQHPEVPQDSFSISSGTQAFFRAHGAHITLELPLPVDASANMIVPLTSNNTVSFDDDAIIRRLAARFGIHQCFSPSPSMEMLVQDLAIHAHSLLASIPMKEPLTMRSWNFVPASSINDTWFLYVDNPNWEDNAEASSSSCVRRPRLELISAPSIAELLLVRVQLIWGISVLPWFLPTMTQCMIKIKLPVTAGGRLRTRSVPVVDG